MTTYSGASKTKLTPAARNILAHLMHKKSHLQVATSPGMNIAWIQDYSGIVRVETIRPLLKLGYLARIESTPGITTYTITDAAISRLTTFG